ncbi:TniB family NTP-binding protein [Paraburkholderia nemoris]|uniref:TniB family NTP-binding protein n=1 Tax=Paraburkholderia nemoris TaxID=2793076 RepID=UPI001F3766DC|nr:TniB family NTP-binding protein [Paraburkholderia nemoris]
MKHDELAHLLPAAREQAQLGNEERVKSLLRDRWIDYPRATEALQVLQRLYETPPRDRMPCLLLHGDSNIGKTKITAKFRRAHPNEFDERRGVERCPVVTVQMPPTDLAPVPRIP